MANAENKAEDQCRQIADCPICWNALTDPRVLPCIHIFCLNCLKRTGETEQKMPGERMPCPICRKDFIIPKDGMNGLQKNFFMEDLREVKTTLQIGSSSISCDMCKFQYEGITGNLPVATMRCLVCGDNYCEGCSEVHKSQTLSRNHEMLKIGTKSEVKNCSKHSQKPLDTYCVYCKKIVCVSCFAESHKLHEGKDVATVDEEFRQIIERNVRKISSYADQMISARNNMDKRMADFPKEIAKAENTIHTRSEELKNMIEEHTKSLLEELSVVKSNQLIEIANNMEEIEQFCTILRSFEAYCTELKESARDICSLVDEIPLRTHELEKDHESLVLRSRRSVRISFQTADLTEVLEKSSRNILGQFKAEIYTTQGEINAFVLGLSDGWTITNDIVQINLLRPNEISTQQQLPTTMKMEATAAVYRNTMYVTGLGTNNDEIWKYNAASGWMKCAPLVKGRLRHSAAFVDEVLYICGGFSVSSNSILDSVEAYDAVSNKCSMVGKLVRCVQDSGNCVPFKNSLYIFGGSDKGFNNFSHVQVYNTKLNNCVLLSKPMPYPYRLMRAALWETSVVLVGRYSCFIFNFETETWQERKQFKTDVDRFGMVLENERIFVIGGGDSEKGKDGKQKWKCRDDVRYIPLRNFLEDKPTEWKIHAKLPQPSLIHVYETLNCFAS